MELNDLISRLDSMRDKLDVVLATLDVVGQSNAAATVWEMQYDLGEIISQLNRGGVSDAISHTD